MRCCSCAGVGGRIPRVQAREWTGTKKPCARGSREGKLDKKAARRKSGMGLGRGKVSGNGGARKKMGKAVRT
jgi:hypothetical protein